MTLCPVPSVTSVGVGRCVMSWIWSLWQRIGWWEGHAGAGLCLEHPWSSSPSGKHPACRKTLSEASGKKFEAGRERRSEQERGLHSLFPMAPVRKVWPTRHGATPGSPIAATPGTAGLVWGVPIPLNPTPQARRAVPGMGTAAPQTMGTFFGKPKQQRGEPPAILGAHMLQGKCHLCV